ncbi:MAG: TrmH family RNA methyltransferase [Ignavibacteria bacterium]
MMENLEQITAEEVKRLSSLKMKKFREKYSQFVIEGEHLIEEAVNSDFYQNIVYVMVRNDYENVSFLDMLSELKILRASAKAFDRITETENPQGIAALLKKPDTEFEFDSDIITVLDNVNDPGNAGTIIRTCYWFDVKQVILGNNSVDLFNPKTVRASQGALFNVRTKETEDLKTELDALLSYGYEILVTSLNGTDIEEIQVSGNRKYALVLGNEANGVSPSFLNNKNYKPVSIKGFSACESLNVAISCGIILNRLRR